MRLSAADLGVDCRPTQSGGGVRTPCKGGGPGLEGIACRLDDLGGVLVMSSRIFRLTGCSTPRRTRGVAAAVVLSGSTCGRQCARVSPGAATARAAAWHPSSVSKFTVMACCFAGFPVSDSNTRIYPEALILKQRSCNALQTISGRGGRSRTRTTRRQRAGARSLIKGRAAPV